MKRIPILEAEKIAKKYGHNQVIILTLKENKGLILEGWATTWNKNKTKCKFLGRIAEILHYNFRAFYSNEEITNEYHKKIN